MSANEVKFWRFATCPIHFKVEFDAEAKLNRMIFWSIQMNKDVYNLNAVPLIGRLLQAYENIFELGFK